MHQILIARRNLTNCKKIDTKELILTILIPATQLPKPQYLGLGDDLFYAKQSHESTCKKSDEI